MWELEEIDGGHGCLVGSIHLITDLLQGCVRAEVLHPMEGTRQILERSAIGKPIFPVPGRTIEIPLDEHQEGGQIQQLALVQGLVSQSRTEAVTELRKCQQGHEMP